MFLIVPIEVRNLRSSTVRPISNQVLVAATILVFVLGQSTGWHLGMTQSWWTVIGYGFWHATPWHLVGNMFVLLIIGNPVNRRLGNGYYAALYLGTLLALGILGRLLGLEGLGGASGAIFAVVAVFLMLMPRAQVGMVFAALFPVTLLIGLLRPPKEWIHWLITWGRFEMPAWGCFILVPLMEVWSMLWWRYALGTWQWHHPAHLLGFLVGIAATLLLPERITMPSRQTV